MIKYPYIMHWQHIKALINTVQVSLKIKKKCSYSDFFQTLIVSDCSCSEGVSSATAALMNQAPPPHFCSTVVRLIALQILNTQVFFY